MIFLLISFISGVLLMKFTMQIGKYSVFVCLKLSDVYESLELFLIFDSLSVFFLFTIMIVSFMVFLYSNSYMKLEVYFNKFIITLFLFVLSMILLVLSGNLFWTMLGWDGLGISSFLLIVFFQNWSSESSGLMTFFCNRMGDLLLVMMISMKLTEGVLSDDLDFNFMTMLLIVVSSFTKSAQFPFSSWLPLAMAAPTPVSSLVHSSTLVTAGLFILLRFGTYLPPQSYDIIFLAASMGLMIAGTSALFELDFKKIIALSTLSHISLMFFFFSLGSKESSSFHMCTHAFFKSMLFMVAGLVIHYSQSMQDIRKMGILFNYHPSNSWFMFIAILSMAGTPAMSGFMSKELMLSSLSINSMLTSFIIFIMSLSMTWAYSIRMLNHLFLNKSASNTVFTKPKSEESLNSFQISSVLSSMGGFWMSNKLFFSFTIWGDIFILSFMKIWVWSSLILGILLSFMLNLDLSKLKLFFSKLWFIEDVSKLPFLQVYHLKIENLVKPSMTMDFISNEVYSLMSNKNKGSVPFLLEKSFTTPLKGVLIMTLLLFFFEIGSSAYDQIFPG